MENRFEQMPEEQGWKAPLPPRPTYPDKAPTTSGTQNGQEVVHTSLNGYFGNTGTQETLRDNLCAWVREKLSDLLDNDGTVRPEQAAGIYAHLAICRACSQEYEELQQLVSLVESLPPAEMPCDFSVMIMQRIEEQSASTHHLNMAPVASTAPAPAVTLLATSPGASNSQVTGTTTLQRSKTETSGLQTTSQTRQQALTTGKLGRVTLGGLLSSGLGYLISSTWCRQMLGVNITMISSWFGQVAKMLAEVPILTWVVYLVVSALAQFGGLLGHTYQTMGTAVAAGLAMDVVICLLAYSFLDARRRQAQMRLY